LVVDDLTLHARGAEDEVAELMPAAVAWMIQELEGTLQLNVSRAAAWKRDSTKKTVAVSSTTALRLRLEPTLRKMGIASQKLVKRLGCDYGGGKQAKRNVQRSRLEKVSKRMGRYRSLGVRGGSHVLKTGGIPALKYGASVLGTPSATLRKVRILACAVRGKMGRRSAFGRLKLARYDPTAGMAIDPIVDWSRGVWDRLVDRGRMEDAWRAAMKEVGLSKRAFQVVRGPCGASVASAHRLGWTFPNFKFLVTRRGEKLDLETVFPATVHLFAERDHEDQQAQGSGLAKKLGFTPNLDPMCQVVGAGRSSAAASLRALGEDGWWTQERLLAEGFPDVVDVCRGCSGPPHNASFKGTLLHRCASCPATEGPRGDFKDQAILDDANSAVKGSIPLFVQGIPPLEAEAMAAWSPQAVIRWCGDRPPADSQGTFTGTAYTDGAMRGGAA
jgi:hypothetical protein